MFLTALYVATLDFAKLSLIFLYIVGQGIHELLSILRAHDDTAYDGSLRHAGSCEDEVDEELVGAVADHSEVGVFAVGYFRTELDLELVLVLILIFLCHFLTMIKN